MEGGVTGASEVLLGTDEGDTLAGLIPFICMILSKGKYSKLEPCLDSTSTLVTLV